MNEWMNEWMKWRNDNLISHLMNSFCISQRKASCSQLWLRDHPRQNLCRWSGCWEKGKRNLCKLYASLETHPLLWINQPNHRDDSLNYQDHDSPKQHILSYGQLVRLHNNIYHAKSTYHLSQQLYMLANVYLRISRLPTVAHFRAAKNIIYIYTYVFLFCTFLYSQGRNMFRNYWPKKILTTVPMRHGSWIKFLQPAQYDAYG